MRGRDYQYDNYGGYESRDEYHSEYQTTRRGMHNDRPPWYQPPPLQRGDQGGCGIPNQPQWEEYSQSQHWGFSCGDQNPQIPVEKREESEG